MIWRLRARSAFGRLAAHGQRARAGALWCTALLDPPESSTPPRVAFAIGRALGPAVVRNRVRRRLREVAREAWSTGRLAPGDYLIGASPDAAALSSAELGVLFGRLMDRLTPPSGPRAG